MRILLDTHVLLWWLEAAVELGAEAGQRIADEATEVLVSAVSVAEIAVMASVGKLEVPDDLLDQIGINDFTPLPLTPVHALGVGDLPLHHRDPFDRLLLAQALAEDVPLMTADPLMSHYDARLLSARR